MSDLPAIRALAFLFGAALCWAVFEWALCTPRYRDHTCCQVCRTFDDYELDLLRPDPSGDRT